MRALLRAHHIGTAARAADVLVPFFRTMFSSKYEGTTADNQTAGKLFYYRILPFVDVPSRRTGNAAGKAAGKASAAWPNRTLQARPKPEEPL